MEEIKLYKPTKEMVDNMGVIALSSKFNKIFYKDLKPNSKMIYCPKCNTYKKVNDEEFKQVRKSKICPTCFYSAQSVSKKQDGVATLFISFRDYGYAVLTQFNFGKKLKTTVRQVAYFKDKYVYTRDIGLSIFGKNLWYYPNSTFWAKRSNVGKSYGYEYEKWGHHFYDYERCIADEVLEYKNKKDYLTKRADFITKSNQKKLVMDNLFSENQMKAIKVFDLKTAEDVYKHTKFIEENRWHLNEYVKEYELNIHYLEYFERENIDLGKYYHYAQNLRLLKMKLDKPKATDFEFRLKKSDEMVEVEKDKLNAINIAQRYETLPKYNSEDISILPFDKPETIRKCGKTLHNCIGGYVEKYANKKTDIYHLDYKGAMKVAIEINNNILTQARADKNSNASDKYMIHIRNFCNMNNIKLGHYA